MKLREDNFTYTKSGRLHLYHTQKQDETAHESDVDAYCGSCHKLLPWSTYEIRYLDGLTLQEVTTKAAELIQSGDISGGNA